MAQFSRQSAYFAAYPALWLATALVAGWIAIGSASADSFNSGVNPSSGRINAGEDAKLPAIAPGETSGAGKQAQPSDTSSPSGAPLPTYQEAERALMMPDSPDPSPGQTTAAAAPAGAAQGSASTTGSAPQADQAGAPPATPAASTAAMANGPVGATTQTAPSTVSERNRILDRVPTLAMPIRLDDAAKDKIRAGAKELGEPVTFKAAPAAAIPVEIAFTAMRDLPEAIGQALPILQGRKLIRTQDRILIVNPRTRVVVGEVAI